MTCHDDSTINIISVIIIIRLEVALAEYWIQFTARFGVFRLLAAINAQ